MCPAATLPPLVPLLSHRCLANSFSPSCLVSARSCSESRHILAVSPIHTSRLIKALRGTGSLPSISPRFWLPCQGAGDSHSGCHAPGLLWGLRRAHGAQRAQHSLSAASGCAASRSSHISWMQAFSWLSHHASSPRLTWTLPQIFLAKQSVTANAFHTLNIISCIKYSYQLGF